MLPPHKIVANKNKIISLLRSTKREGMESVIQYLEKSGFYEAPSSIYRHHNWKGGLAEHSLGVYRIASRQNNGLPHDSIIIAGVLHDICKASKLYYNANGIIQRRHTHIKGHGRRSILLLKQCGLSLTNDERLAIRWHMGGHHASRKEYKEVIVARQNPLWKVIHQADQLDASRKYRRRS